MQSKRTVESAVPIWRREDPNYPGVPQPPPEVVARSTSRSTVDYDTYVLRFSRELRLNALLMTVGIVLIIGAMFYLSGIGLITVAAVGVGLGISGFVGYMAADRAHSSYTRDLAVSVSETYERPTPPPQPQTVRPFVASGNGDGRTTNTGRLDFTPEMWRDFFDRALANGGAVNRDDVAKKALGRQWYYGEGYGKLLEELTRLGFVDARNRLTPAALAWYEQQIPLPLTSIPTRPRVGRTDGRTDGADGAFQGGRGVGE